jgi:predicted Zn-dependent protease
MIHRKTVLACALAAALAAPGCTTNPATGEKQFTPFMSSSQEAAIGAEAHPQLVDEFGGEVENAKLTSYVTAVGKSLGAVTETPDQAWSFTVLNSPIVNAFALPGGYVHISRGLMAYFNDEAEMASVLGHEIGHVTARHAAERYNRQVLAGLGGAAVGVVTNSDTLAGLVNSGGQLYLLSYSRSQESQADALGIRYIARDSYDPYGAVRMLEALEAITELETQKAGGKADATPSWARTHPLTSQRIADAKVRADALEPKPANPSTNRDRYLDAVDGMLFGDDPAQGVIRGNDFLHAGFKLAFTAPADFTLQNTASAVIGSGPSNARFLFTGGVVASSLATRDYLDQAWAALFENNLPPSGLSNIEKTATNGIEGLTGTARVTSGSTQLDVRLAAWRYDATHAFHFVFITTPETTSILASPLQKMALSFRKLSSSEAAAIKPYRIKVVTVGASDTVASLAARMVVPSYKEETFRVLNGLGAGDALKAGSRVKIIVEG